MAWHGFILSRHHTYRFAPTFGCSRKCKSSSWRGLVCTSSLDWCCLRQYSSQKATFWPTAYSEGRFVRALTHRSYAIFIPDNRQLFLIGVVEINIPVYSESTGVFMTTQSLALLDSTVYCNIRSGVPHTAVCSINRDVRAGR